MAFEHDRLEEQNEAQGAQETTEESPETPVAEEQRPTGEDSPEVRAFLDEAEGDLEVLGGLRTKVEALQELTLEHHACAAQTHRHWLVRLASLALCELEPGLLLAVWPEDEAANAFWVAHWAPRVVAGRLARQRAIALGHEQVENLSAELAGGSDKAPALAALARILCALASHHLRHDIELDDEMYVAIDETDIEVEG